MYSQQQDPKEHMPNPKSQKSPLLPNPKNPKNKSQAVFAGLGFASHIPNPTNPKTTNPKLGIAPWDMHQKPKSHSQDHKSQDPKCSLGYEQQIPRTQIPRTQIPRTQIKVGIGQIPRHQIPIPKAKTQTWNSALGYAAEKQIPRPQIPRPKVQLGI